MWDTSGNRPELLQEMTTIMSLVGIGTLFGLALLLSENRRHLNYRTVATAFALQVAMAALILYVPNGDVVLNGLVQAVQNVIDYADVGITFLFGPLAAKTGGLIFAIHVLPVIVFFASLMATLYYLGVMQRVVSFLGGVLHRLLKTSRTESMSAVANIFMGHTEAPLVVRPYLAATTNSEMFAIMTVGMATIAGAVMAGFAAMGVSLKYLLTASFMGAPGGLLMAKIIVPETDYRDPQLVHVAYSDESKPVNIFEAAANGARDGLMLALTIGAMLLAFIALIALLNGFIGWVGGLVGLESLTFQQILGYLLAPLAFLLGVPWSEAIAAGSLIGQKFVVNEFVAYVSFVDIREQLSSHTQVVLTFALCGFANLSSIAMMLGGLGSLVPERRHDIARMGLKAVVAGTLASLMSAVLAGLFVSLQAP
jgi:CNT family concentrative nucleoside transporter